MEGALHCSPEEKPILKLPSQQQPHYTGSPHREDGPLCTWHALMEPSKISAQHEKRFAMHTLSFTISGDNSPLEATDGSQYVRSAFTSSSSKPGSDTGLHVVNATRIEDGGQEMSNGVREPTLALWGSKAR